MNSKLFTIFTLEFFFPDELEDSQTKLFTIFTLDFYFHFTTKLKDSQTKIFTMFTLKHFGSSLVATQIVRLEKKSSHSLRHESPERKPTANIV